jgi:transaldolase
MNRLRQFIQYGQAYWIDNLIRGMIKSGELNTRVTEHGLRGVTSNPAIFHKAIAGSNDDNAQIQQLVHQGPAIHEIYEQLIVTDIQAACDILRSVYDDTHGMDGYVSLEVSFYLAHDTEGTMQEVRRLWHAVKRPNLFIWPAACSCWPFTICCIPSCRCAIRAGIWGWCRWARHSSSALPC